jgi:hypothetical protein
VVFTSSSWQGDQCLSDSTTLMIAVDAYTESKKITNGAFILVGSYYSNCSPTGATKFDFFVLSTDPVTGAAFLPKKVKIDTSLNGAFTQSECSIESSSYVCVEVETIEETISIDAIIKADGEDQNTDTTTTVVKGPGFTETVKMTKKGYSAAVIKNVITLGQGPSIVIPDTAASVSVIGKVVSGKRTRTISN